MAETVLGLLESLQGNLQDMEAGLARQFRIMVYRSIVIAGNKEKTVHVSTHSRDFFNGLIQSTHRSVTADHNRKIEAKILYTRMLFNLVQEYNISDFFSDLKYGLDYVIDRWDASPTPAEDHNYQNVPQSAVRRLRSRARKQE